MLPVYLGIAVALGICSYYVQNSFKDIDPTPIHPRPKHGLKKLPVFQYWHVIESCNTNAYQNMQYDQDEIIKNAIDQGDKRILHGLPVLLEKQHRKQLTKSEQNQLETYLAAITDSVDDFIRNIDIERNHYTVGKSDEALQARIQQIENQAAQTNNVFYPEYTEFVDKCTKAKRL